MDRIGLDGESPSTQRGPCPFNNERNVPSTTDSPGGVRLTGVRSESAADEAGLQAGDIIVQIGEHEVKDLMGLQRALVAHKSGDVVTIVFLRDGERMETTATLR